jgi:hypothetical protein
MRTHLLLPLLLCAAPAIGFTPDFLFVPMAHADGSRTWSLSMALKIIPESDRELPRDARDRKLVGAALGFHRFCDSGWLITDSRENEKTLTIEGKCL